MKNELKLYKVNIKYIRNLTNVEARFHKQGEEIPIMQNSPQTNNKGDANKQGRPYLGILVLIEDRKYCIPLCSLDEKPKYDTMSENITMRKIRDENGNVIGILNINNMIPVRDEYLEEIETEIQSTDSNNTKEHKILHQKELTWCKNNIKEIQHLAEDLHQMVCNGENFKKRKICPNYTALENECDKAKKMPNRQKQKQQKKLQKQNNHKNNNDKNNRGSGSSSVTKRKNNSQTNRSSSNKRVNKIVADRARVSLMEFRQSLVALTNAISEALESVLYTHQTILNIDYSSRNNYDNYE